jgi:hypothetical protein
MSQLSYTNISPNTKKKLNAIFEKKKKIEENWWILQVIQNNDWVRRLL